MNFKWVCDYQNNWTNERQIDRSTDRPITVYFVSQWNGVFVYVCVCVIFSIRQYWTSICVQNKFNIEMIDLNHYNIWTFSMNVIIFDNDIMRWSPINNFFETMPYSLAFLWLLEWTKKNATLTNFCCIFPCLQFLQRIFGIKSTCIHWKELKFEYLCCQIKKRNQQNTRWWNCSREWKEKNTLCDNVNRIVSSFICERDTHMNLLLSKLFFIWWVMIYIWKIKRVQSLNDQWKLERNIPYDELLIGIEIWLKRSSNDSILINNFIYLRLAIFHSSRFCCCWYRMTLILFSDIHDATSLSQYTSMLEYRPVSTNWCYQYII